MQGLRTASDGSFGYSYVGGLARLRDPRSCSLMGVTPLQRLEPNKGDKATTWGGIYHMF